jgi:hypothetical protein
MGAGAEGTVSYWISWIEGFGCTLVAGFSHFEGMFFVGLELKFDRQ